MSRAPRLRSTLIALLATLAAGHLPAQDGPVVRGRVVVADTGRIDGLRAFVRWRASGDTALRVDSAAVDSSGRFAVALRGEPADSLDLIVDAADREARAYVPALARIHPRQSGTEHGFVLVPRRWTIPAGSYAGQTVALTPHGARMPVCARCSVFWVRIQPQGQEEVGYQGWPVSRFPLRVGFDREHSVPAGSAPDSAAFWRVLTRVEAAFGMDLFRPVRYSQTLSQGLDQDGPDNVVLVMIDPSLRVAGLTMLLGRRGTVQYAALSLRERASVLGPSGSELVSHEMMHALGFGHTCAWRSVSADLQRCPQLRAPSPTPEDVAHAQVLYRVRDLQRAGGYRWGLDAAVAGERALLLGIGVGEP